MAYPAHLREMISRYDWAATPLGPVPDWPASLRTAVDICVSSRFPMVIFWGPGFRLLYNDAYVPILGAKHPGSLGQPAAHTWAEIWPTIGPMLTGVLRTGEATFSEEQLLIVQRAGYPEEAYFTFSYSPIAGRGPDVGGVFCAVTERTTRVLAARRRITLHRLGALPVAASATAEEACQAALAVVGENPADVPFTLAYLRAPDSGTVTLAGTAGFASQRAVATFTTAPVLHQAVSGALSTQAPRELTDPRLLAAAAIADRPGLIGGMPPAKTLILPFGVAGAGPPAGVLCCGVSPYCVLDDDYRAFFELTALQLGTLVADVRSWEAERIRAAQLAELDQAKTVFFSNISHEFRTPLSLIMVPVEELRMAPAGTMGAAAQENLEVIHRNAVRLSKLVNTLLDFSRIEAGRMEGRYEPVDLAAITADLAAVFRAAIEKAGLAFEVDCPALGGPVYVDQDMWEKVVLNLLSNALKYTFAGSIRVSLRREPGDPGWAVLQVTDSGTGIPEPDMPHLFERFHRVYQARSRSNEGSGIGLALIRELAGLHGGSITADSVLGVGSTFTVRLPLGCAHLPADRLAPDPPPSGPPSNAAPYVLEALRWSAGTGDPAAGTDEPPPGARPSRVLIADDNADMREYLRRLLTPGYTVCTVSNGTAALALARAEHPDLIISDVMMPGLDGLALVSVLRGDRATASIPLLLLSARAGQDATVAGLSAGADDYLAKPFSAEELLARVRATLEPARLRLREARLREALVASMQEGFFVRDERGMITDVNDVFGTITGYGPAGLPYAEPYPWAIDPAQEPDLGQLYSRAHAEALTAKQGRYTMPIRHRDGRQRWVASIVRAIPGWGRPGQVLVGTLRDVTDEHNAAAREAAVSRLATGLAGAADIGQVLTAALAEVRQAFGARRVVAAIWPPHAPVLVAGLPETGGWPTLDAAARSGLEAARFHQIPHLAVEAGGGGQPTSVASRLAAGGGDAAIWLDRGARGPLTLEDRVLFGVLSAHLGNALARAIHYEQARDLAVALQHSVLGQTALPAGFGVRYRPAMRPLEVGGDWYDVISLGRDRFGVVVGDCVGRGLDAAVTMGQLRSACRALLLRDAAPAQVLTDLDSFAEQVSGAACSTVFCAIIDVAAASIRYSSAGHPPGILAHPGGSCAELLDRATTVPLAVTARQQRAEATALLRSGSALLLYTDGLIERRGERLDLGIRAAAELLQQHIDGTPDELADRLVAGLVPAGGFADDSLVLTYRQAPARLRLNLPAEPASLAGMRQNLRRWLAASAVSPPVAGQVALAASEACSNAIEHAYRGDPSGQVRLTAELHGPRLDLVVADGSRWKPAAPDRGDRGHGLAMMRAFMADVVIEPTASGTTVRMSRDVR